MYGPTAVGDQNRAALRTKICEVTGKELPPIMGKIAVDAANAAEYTLPLDAFVAAHVARKDDETGEMVVDLPRLQQWVLWFKDIVSGGYEKGRERWKIKRGTHIPPSAEDIDITAGSVEPVKGFTRLSTILWTLHHGISYMEKAIESLAMENYLADYEMFKTYPFPVDLGAMVFRRILGYDFPANFGLVPAQFGLVGAFWAKIPAHFGPRFFSGGLWGHLFWRLPGELPRKDSTIGQKSSGLIHASGALVVWI